MPSWSRPLHDSIISRLAGNGPQELGIGLIAGVVLALLGPAGSFDAGLGNRLLFWVPLLVLGAFVGGVVSRWTSRRLRHGESKLKRWAILTIVIGLPMGLVAWGLAELVFTTPGQFELAAFIWPSLLVSGSMTALMGFLNTPGTETKATPGAKPKLLDRLPLHQQDAELLAVASEDHYLRVYTTVGDCLILLRLGDAFSELDGIEGAQTHRSWWVAKAAITKAHRQGRNWSLELKNGTFAPVSRANIKVLREDGWLN